MSTGSGHHISEELNNGIKMLGNAWMLCIVGTLAKKEMRFSEIQRSVVGINPTTLASRLKKLEKEKMIIRKKETLDKLSVTYSLSEKGKGILPILKEIQIFADKFL
jgi:DNA-binding HxlR family transcriptional regulator